MKSRHIGVPALAALGVVLLHAAAVAGPALPNLRFQHGTEIGSTTGSAESIVGRAVSENVFEGEDGKRYAIADRDVGRRLADLSTDPDVRIRITGFVEAGRDVPTISVTRYAAYTCSAASVNANTAGYRGDPSPPTLAEWCDLRESGRFDG